ncbi:MAG TPA: acyl-CoA dehydrogenase family protein [Stellaceae bacterium]|nr:acyl-CoA dehydrogenase family protein [Stellaceae bacterium]
MSDTLVQDSARRLFADLVPPAVVNAAEDGSWPEGVWDAVAEAGFPDALAASAAAPGDLSGMGDAAAILREAGRHAAPLPLAETMIARWLLAGAGIDAPEGPLTLANVERFGRFALRRHDSGWRIEGRATGVPWAAEARGIVACAENQVALIPRETVDIRPGKSLAGEPRDDIAFEAVVDAKPLHGVDAAAVYRLGALTRAVLIAGALDEVLDLTVQYANDRVQFGRPIAKFQAIQQQLSVLAENVAAAGVVAGAAVEAVAGAGAAHFAIAVAKARCGEAAGKVAEIAHQVHGAIGFTHEHRLHHLTRRLWSWRDEFGVESEWAIELGRLAASKGGDGLWPLLTGW